VDAINKLKAAMSEVNAVTAEQLRLAGKPTRYVERRRTRTLDPWIPRRARDLRSSPRCMRYSSWKSRWIRAAARSGDQMTTAVDAGRSSTPRISRDSSKAAWTWGSARLREQYVAGQTRDWVSFKFPRIRQSFEMETILRETPRTKGPLGAVGVARMTMVPTAPA